MVGLLLAVLSGLFFSSAAILTRKGVYHSGESFTAIPISNFAGMALFGLTIVASGNAAQLTLVSWKGLGYLVAAGVVHFIIGRLLFYTSLRLIGANRTNPISSFNILITAMLGIVLLNEPLTGYLIPALILVTAGTVFISRTGGAGMGTQAIPKRSLVTGVLASLGAAICWGISPLLVKLGIQEVASPVIATFISYTAASVIAAAMLIHPANIRKLRHLGRNSLPYITAGGVATAIAQIVRYIALGLSPISLISPANSAATVLFVPPLSFLVNRRLESFTAKIFLGTTSIIIGVLLLFLSA
ncbi:MAG: DMT family transporter [Chloroflexi bacterium]|nr:DMT family transporter [Chloroflexota bacterium]